MSSLYDPLDPSFEQSVLDELSYDAPWELIERFSTLVRESGSEDEWTAARYVCERLDKFGVPYNLHSPDLFLSVPESASVEVNGTKLRAKPPSFSASTPSGGVTAELTYVPRNPEANGDFFSAAIDRSSNVRGRIVITDGFGFPEAVSLFEEMGAVGQIYVNPGEDIHWGTCTTIWGAPDLDSAPRQPRSTVAAVNQSDGRELIEMAKGGGTQATIHTKLREGWFSCPLVVAEIRGSEEPERFVLAHGHIDSWDVGIGDNAVGDATLLELARAFHNHRDRLRRTLRIAWWPGHSTGRYAGSTWYADRFAMDLERNCIAQVDIDSPGCRWATEYHDVSWMTETEDLCTRVIGDATGKDAEGERPHQAGDYSFNNIGITGFFMLLSTMPRELVDEKGYYPVGGCGGNIAWHTENDTLEIADRENLMRDLSVYVTALSRVSNNAIHPFDFRRLAAELRETLLRYSKASDEEIDFSEALTRVDVLSDRLDDLHGRIPKLSSASTDDPSVRRINDCLLELGRILIPINFTRRGRFRNEPAVPIPPLPDVEPVLRLGAAEGHERQVLRTHVTRGLNRVASALGRASGVVDAANAAIDGKERS